MLESIEDCMGSAKAFWVAHADMSKCQDACLHRFAAYGYLSALESWLNEGMAQTPQEIGEHAASRVRMPL